MTNSSRFFVVCTKWLFVHVLNASLVSYLKVLKLIFINSNKNVVQQAPNLCSLVTNDEESYRQTPNPFYKSVIIDGRAILSGKWIIFGEDNQFSRRVTNRINCNEVVIRQPIGPASCLFCLLAVCIQLAALQSFIKSVQFIHVSTRNTKCSVKCI